MATCTERKLPSHSANCLCNNVLSAECKDQRLMDSCQIFKFSKNFQGGFRTYATVMLPNIICEVHGAISKIASLIVSIMRHRRKKYALSALFIKIILTKRAAKRWDKNRKSAFKKNKIYYDFLFFFRPMFSFRKISLNFAFPPFAMTVNSKVLLPIEHSIVLHVSVSLVRRLGGEDPDFVFVIIPLIPLLDVLFVFSLVMMLLLLL